MTTGEGGMVTTADPDLADRMRLLREHGMRVRYQHEIVGYNFRMTDIHASIGLAQLAKLSGYNDRRRAIAARYDRELRGVIAPVVPLGVTHVYHQYTIRANWRNEFAGNPRRCVGTASTRPGPPPEAPPRSATAICASW
jgi:dTDP-4-amino-4,6-dideoxygalactose transaminase